METLASSSPTSTYLPTLDHRANELSPSPRAFLTQHILLRILRRRASNMSLVTLRYNCRVVSLAQHERKVVAQTTYGRIVAHYCVGCDGSNGITYATGFQTPPTSTACVATAVCYTPQGTPYALSLGQSTSFTGISNGFGGFTYNYALWGIGRILAR